MRTAVLGCGAIGGLILGYLSKEGVDITGITRNYQKDPFFNEGLKIEGVRGSLVCKVKADTELKESVDIAVIATKMGGIRQAVERNLEFLKNAVVVAVQNGIGADYILEEYFSRNIIVSGIVMFGATFYPPNRVVHNFEGGIALGSMFGVQIKNIDRVSKVLSTAFNVSILGNIKGAKYLKVFVNLNNCLPALMGVSIQEAFSDLEIAKLAMKLNREAYEVVKKSGINLESLPNYPKERLEELLSLDLEEAANIFSKIMVSLSKEPLYGSILQSIKRGKESEIDYINGEIVNLARRGSISAPLNEKVVNLVHRTEKTGRFLSKKELLGEIL